MKRIFVFISLVLTGIAMCACQTEDDQSDVAYTLVQSEILPSALNMEANLDEYEPVTFEWTEAEWDGYGVATYDLAFVREGGDFTKPIMVFHAASLDSAVRTKRTLSKEEIKELYSAASLTSKDSEVMVDWVVRTAAGGKKLQSETVGKLVMTMTPDPDPFVAGDDNIYILGDGAAEAGRKMTYIPSIDYHMDKAIAVHYNDNAPLKTFDYEIFTKLTAGKPVWFCTSAEATGDSWFFAFNGESAADATTIVKSIKKDAVLTATVAEDGIYRIRINTSTNETYVKKINRVSLRYWPGPKDTDMTYMGNGTWQVDCTVDAKSLGYKFLFFGLDSDQPHGAQYMDINLDDDGSMANVDPKYWYIITVQGGAAQALNKDRANGTWRVPAEALGKECTYTINMNDEAGAYTSSITVK